MPSFKKLKTKRSIKALELRIQQEKLREKLKVYNKQRRYLKQYLIGMHIFKTGILKLAYYFYSKTLSKKAKRSNKAFVILLNKHMIMYLRNEFTEKDITTEDFKKFQSEYERNKTKKPSFDRNEDRINKYIASLKHIDLIEQMSMEDESESQSKPDSKFDSDNKATLASTPLLTKPKLTPQRDSVNDKITNVLRRNRSNQKPPLGDKRHLKSNFLPTIGSKDSLNGVKSALNFELGNDRYSKMKALRNKHSSRKKKLQLQYLPNQGKLTRILLNFFPINLRN